MVVPRRSAKDELISLMAERDKLEKSISDYGAILAANDNVGMRGPLVDDEGFPRNDIDIYQVRQARQQINCLQNDHRALMKKIEELLTQVHQEAKEAENGGISTKMEENVSDSTTEDTTTFTPVVSVNLVSPGSPAESAGLKVGDAILQFGSINSKNFENNLNQIGALVRNMENKRIPLKVKRNNELLDLSLIPMKWTGRGLLGCNIVLPETVER